MCSRSTPGKRASATWKHSTWLRRATVLPAAFGPPAVFVADALRRRPGRALSCFALLFRKRKYFVEHVVVATHFWSFNLVLLGILLPVVALPVAFAFGEASVSAMYATHDGLLSLLLQGCFAVYLFLMLRRAYGASRWYSAVVSLAIAWSMFHILWLYRFILFVTTMRLV